jgi:hypothetical protein
LPLVRILDLYPGTTAPSDNRTSCGKLPVVGYKDI